MSPVIDCTDDEGLAKGVEAAAEAVRCGLVVVLPTDTVYGVGADAFDSAAVAAVLTAKGRGRDMPLPVLVPNTDTVDGLATDVPAYVRKLIDAFWPGPLTVVLRAQSSLLWDLGETNGTVALRMPKNDVALTLLTEVGPMAVTSANVSGQPPATTILDAATQLGSAVSVYLDAGPSAGGSDSVASTILDCTGDNPVILRPGAISDEQIQDALAETELAETELAETELAETELGASDLAETDSAETAPGETAPGETAPGETAPGETDPGQTDPGKSEPGKSEPAS